MGSGVVAEEYLADNLQAYTETGQSPYADPDVMLAACVRPRADGTIPEDAEPPTLALIPIVRDAGMRNDPGDMSPGTRAMAVDVFREDVTLEDVNDDDTVPVYDWARGTRCATTRIRGGGSH